MDDDKLTLPLVMRAILHRNEERYKQGLSPIEEMTLADETYDCLLSEAVRIWGFPGEHRDHPTLLGVQIKRMGGC
jgi:hypothetical protein